LGKRHFYKVNIEITNLCNLQCTFCPEVERPKKWMSPELFRSVLTEVAPLTRSVALHLMGEPLLHPQLDQIVGICIEQKVPLFLVSNGVLLKEKHEAFLYHPIFRQISFSLHSFRDNYGDKDPTDYLERIFNFSERAIERNPRLFINYRLWNSDPSQKLSDRNGDFLERIEARFGAKLPRSWSFGEDKKARIGNRLSVHFDEAFVWPSLKAEDLSERGTCQALSSHFGVLVDGTVVPCCLDKEGNIPLGKIGETPLNQILTSEKATALLQGFRKGVLVDPLCRKCQYITRFETKDRDQAASTATRSDSGTTDAALGFLVSG
jgi:radical SAM protein with 4Fe4S-binding SPASM domain